MLIQRDKKNTDVDHRDSDGAAQGTYGFDRSESLTASLGL
jgi:hypothetical protein